MTEAAQILNSDDRYTGRLAGVFGVGSTTYLLNQMDKGLIRGLVVHNSYNEGYLSIQKAADGIKKGMKQERICLDSYYIERSDIRNRKFEKMLYPMELAQGGENETIQIWTVFLTVILGAFALYRCFADRRPDRKEPESVRIGITLYRDDDTFYQFNLPYSGNRSKKYEKTEGIRMILDVMDAKEDQNTQNSQVDRFLALGCDVICVNMVDRSAASVIIDKAMDREVPVIFFNREPVSEDLNRWEKLFYVGANPKEEGVCQGNMIADAYDACPEILDLNGDGKVSYVILEGERGHQDSLMRTEWAVQTLKNRGVDLEKLTGGSPTGQRSQADALWGSGWRNFRSRLSWCSATMTIWLWGLLIRCAAWALSGRCVWQGLTALRLDWMQWSLVLCLEQW